MSFKVFDISHLNTEADFKAELYTTVGYFEAMEVWIGAIAKQRRDFEKEMKKYLKVDLLWQSLEKYSMTGGAPESAVPKPKRISEDFFQRLKDPSNFRLKINDYLASNSDLNQMSPSDFAYYIVDNVSVGRRSNVQLITKEQFENYINVMKNAASYKTYNY